MKPSIAAFIGAILIAGNISSACGALTNIALHRPYVWSAAPNYTLCADPGDQTQLTDGQYTAGYFWAQKTTVGWQNISPVLITIDLGSVQAIRGASFNTAAGVAGVQWPQMIEIFVSDDGKNFQDLGDLTDLDREPMPALDKYAVHRYWTDSLRAHGRYVAFAIEGEPFVFADEIEVYEGSAGWIKKPFEGPSGTVENLSSGSF